LAPLARMVRACSTIVGLMLSGFEEDLAQKTHFEIVGHYLELYGYCEECRKKAL
jgi:Fur family ferric uptake transcriptional regulator